MHFTLFLVLLLAQSITGSPIFADLHLAMKRDTEVQLVDALYMEPSRTASSAFPTLVPTSTSLPKDSNPSEEKILFSDKETVEKHEANEKTKRHYQR